MNQLEKSILDKLNLLYKHSIFKFRVVSEKYVYIQFMGEYNEFAYCQRINCEQLLNCNHLSEWFDQDIAYCSIDLDNSYIPNYINELPDNNIYNCIFYSKQITSKYGGELGNSKISKRGGVLKKELIINNRYTIHWVKEMPYSSKTESFEEVYEMAQPNYIRVLK